MRERLEILNQEKEGLEEKKLKRTWEYWKCHYQTSGDERKKLKEHLRGTGKQLETHLLRKNPSSTALPTGLFHCKIFRGRVKGSVDISIRRLKGYIKENKERLITDTT